jgi:hypothetical protein
MREALASAFVYREKLLGTQLMTVSNKIIAQRKWFAFVHKPKLSLVRVCQVSASCSYRAVPRGIAKGAMASFPPRGWPQSHTYPAARHPAREAWPKRSEGRCGLLGGAGMSGVGLLGLCGRLSAPFQMPCALRCSHTRDLPPPASTVLPVHGHGKRPHRTAGRK